MRQDEAALCSDGGLRGEGRESGREREREREQRKEKRGPELTLYPSPTPQVSLHEKYAPGGHFEIVGFPTGDFNQELSTDAKVADFTAKRGVTFPLATLSHVNGARQNEVYEWLKDATATENRDITWNFGEWREKETEEETEKERKRKRKRVTANPSPPQNPRSHVLDRRQRRHPRRPLRPRQPRRPH